MTIFSQIKSFEISISTQDALIDPVPHLVLSYPPTKKGLYYGKLKARALVTLAIMGKAKPSRNVRIKLIAHGKDDMEVLIYKQTVRARD